VSELSMRKDVKMSTSANQPTLDNILKALVFNNREIDRKRINRDITEAEETRQRVQLHKEAKQQLSQLIGSIIGEDETSTSYNVPINATKSMQRQRAKEAGIDLKENI
jgi:hypothetical protein